MNRQHSLITLLRTAGFRVNVIGDELFVTLSRRKVYRMEIEQVLTNDKYNIRQEDGGVVVTLDEEAQ